MIILIFRDLSKKVGLLLNQRGIDLWLLVRHVGGWITQETLSLILFGAVGLDYDRRNAELSSQNLRPEFDPAQQETETFRERMRQPEYNWT